VPILGRAQVDVIGVDEAWLEAAVDEDWLAAYRIVQQEGAPVIAEVRVFPREAGARTAGEWSGSYLGLLAAVPQGGITARLLRTLRLGATPASDISEGREAWKRYVGISPEFHRHFKNAGFRGVKRKVPATGGRRGWSGDQLLDAAVFYVSKTAAGSRRPVAELAKRKGITPSSARDLLQTAKDKGLLTPGRQGVASRSLTERAKQLLAAKGK
jgi:hypothetical protein